MAGCCWMQMCMGKKEVKLPVVDLVESKSISGSETATLNTEAPQEQHLEQESSGQQHSNLTVLNLVRKDTCTFTHKRGTRLPGKMGEPSNTVDLPEALHEKKEYSRSKTEKRRNSRENERKNLLERRDSQNMRSSGGKRYSLLASPAQLRMDLEKQILGKILPGTAAGLGNISLQYFH